jgi:hypothetical protein
VLVEDFNQHVGFGFPVVVCVDEFNVSSAKEFELLLLRNLLRHVHVIPVILGTNSK